jgi:hypothetical protein
MVLIKNQDQNPMAAWLGILIFVPISGTPIVCRIPIPFSIPKIPVRLFFEIPMSGESENWNLDLQYLEFG